MREILFRAKTIENNQWVEGYFVYVPCSRFLSKEWLIQTIKEDGRIGQLHTVYERTVGQFTGLRDMTGLLVFEGDILKIAKRSDSRGGYYHPPIDYPVNVVVKWDHCGWMWETLCEDKRYIGFPEAWGHYLCEVIGNIHDNPELLGGTDHE